MARTITGIDAGLRTVKLLKGQYKGNTFHATDFAVHANESGSLGGGWSQVEGGFMLGPSRVGLTGRDVNVRYTRVPRVAGPSRVPADARISPSARIFPNG